MIVSARHADITNSDNIVIYDLNMEIREGDFIYITGKVGSGKTSIFRSLIAEYPPAAGELRVCSLDLNKIRQKDIPLLRRRIGVVFQDLQLLSDRNVHDNLSFVLKATGWKKEAEMEKRIEEVLTLTGMNTKSHRFPHQLSGGEQQRVCIARALLNDPEIILADEPTGSLDRDTAEGIMQLFEEVNRKGTAIVIITHDLSLIEKHPATLYICENESCHPYIPAHEQEGAI
ncbi:MAG: cell division ATP-binding protein FtsE [Candidatus Cryptobacteroides sp.]